MKFEKLKLTLAGLIISVCSLNSNAGIIISGDLTNGTGVFTITDDIVFNLVGGPDYDVNADPYVILFHDWRTIGKGWYKSSDSKHLLGDDVKLDLTREPSPFATDGEGHLIDSSGNRGHELSSAPLFDGNWYNRGFALFFSDTSQRVKWLKDGDTFVIGAGTWDMPEISGWDLYGEFNGEATIYMALGTPKTWNTELTTPIPVATTYITSVPEPSTLAIFALGMIGLASRRFKKQS